jgi:dihydrofolate synthase/folylpolyglutamate synthase
MDSFLKEGNREEWAPVELTIPLLGRHQLTNAATAYAALQVVRDNGLDLNGAAIAEGFASVDWPGRFEVLWHLPPVVVDSAHNRDSAHQLRLTLDEYFPKLPVILVIGVSEDKDIAGIFAMLAQRVHRVIATRSSHPRAILPERLAELASQSGLSASASPAVGDALKDAIQLVSDDTEAGAVLVTGSIFVAAEARFTWYNQLKPKFHPVE